MKLKLVPIAVLFLCAAALRAGEWDGTAFAQAEGNGIRAWFVLPTRMVPADADLPAAAADEKPKPFELRAGRNEYECAQLVVMLAKPLAGASVEFSDFNCEGATIPAAAWKANRLGEVPAQRPDHAAPILKTWPPDPPSIAQTVPDVLLPGQSFDLDAGLSRIWLTVRLPKDAKPGVYRGHVRLKPAIELPIQLRVWNYTLPDESSLMVLANVWPNAEFFKQLDNKPLWDHLRPYYDDLKAHRINATGEIYPPPVWRRNEPPPALGEYERALKYVLDDLNFSRFRFPGVIGAGRGSWQQARVFDEPPKQLADTLWINGAVSDQPQPVQAAYSGKETAGGHEFQTESADSLWIWVQPDSTRSAGKQIVILDGKEVGTLDEGAAMDNPYGFCRVDRAVKVSAGKHTLQIVGEESAATTMPAADPIHTILLTPLAQPDFEKLMRDRAPLDPAFKDAFTYHARLAADWLRSHSWLKKANAKLIDTPDIAEYGRVVALYDFVGDVLPTVRREIATPPALALRKSIELWECSLASSEFKPDRWIDALKPPDELWAYHNFLHTIGYPSVSTRLIPWILGRHGMRGYVFWSVNFWNGDPWKDTVQNGSFMRGTLVFPDPKTGDPIDSVRWELFREGLEDFETLRLLRSAVDEAGGKQQSAANDARKLLDEDVPALIRSARDFSWDPAALEAIRTRAGELLGRLTPAEQ